METPGLKPGYITAFFEGLPFVPQGKKAYASTPALSRSKIERQRLFRKPEGTLPPLSRLRGPRFPVAHRNSKAKMPR